MSNTSLSTVISGLTDAVSGLYTAASTAKTNITNLQGVTSGFTGVASISAAISGNATNITALQNALSANASVDAQSAAESSVWSRLYAIQQAIGEGQVAQNIRALSSALSGYNDPNDVSAAFETLSTAIDDVASTYVKNIADSDTINLSYAAGADGATLSADVTIASISGNTLSATPNGLVSKFSIEKQANTGKYDFKAPNGDIITTLDVALDSILSSGTYDKDTNNLTLVFNTLSGTETVTINLADIVDVNDLLGGDGVQVLSGKTIKAKINTAENDGQFLTLTSAGIGLSGITEAIEEASNGLEEKISGAFVADKIVIGTADGLTSSAYSITSDTTSGAVSGASTIVNAEAISAFVDSKITANNFAKLAMPQNQVVLGDRDGIRGSGKFLGEDEFSTTSPSTTIATQLGVANYVTASVSGFQADLEAINTAISGLNA